MRKVQIARYEQFLLFPQCFKKAWFPRASKRVIVWEWVKQYRLRPALTVCINWPGLKLFATGKCSTWPLYLITRPFSKTKSSHVIWGLVWYNALPRRINPLPDNRLSDCSKLKAFADDKLNVIQNIKVVFRRKENIVGKEENAGYQHFLLFPQCFQKV